MSSALQRHQLRPDVLGDGTCADDQFLLTATAAAGSVFTGWTGCTSVNAQNQCTVVLNSNTTVTANFVTHLPADDHARRERSGDGREQHPTADQLRCARRRV